MMYVKFMKNFLLADSSEQMAVLLFFLLSWPKWVQQPSARSNRREENFSWTSRTSCPFYSYFLDMLYVKFMKNFLLADSSEQMAVGLISDSWARKRLIPNFKTWCTSSSWKIFFSPIQASRCLLDSFPPPEPNNVWFLLSRHDVLRVNEKFSSRRFRRVDAC